MCATRTSLPRQGQAESARAARDQNDPAIERESTGKHTDDVDLRVTAIETCDFARGLTVDSAFFQIGALISRDFAVGEAEFSFELSALPIKFENDQRTPGDLRLAVKFYYLLSM